MAAVWRHIPAANAGHDRGPRTTTRSRQGSYEVLWLELAGAVSAWRDSGAGDGNRTDRALDNATADQ